MSNKLTQEDISRIQSAGDKGSKESKEFSEKAQSKFDKFETQAQKSVPNPKNE